MQLTNTLYKSEQVPTSSRRRHQLARQREQFYGMTKTYSWLAICHIKWRFQGSTMLTYFTKCSSQFNRNVEETWSRYACFCTTVHLVMGHMLDKLQDLIGCTFEEMRHPPYFPVLAPRGGSSPKILGGTAPIRPFITESIFSVLRKRKNTNFI